MRVAIVTESFLPHMNGVTGSVLQVSAHLRDLGHEVLVIAPKAPGSPADASDASVPRTALLASVALPTYPDVRVALAPVAQLKRILAGFAPDASMRYGSMDPMVGREAVRGGLTWLYT